ncbi:acyl-CoA thioesterase-2 [Ilumatobacter fluminis]|uniref:Acyl-CoA thioesterase-2 n=1 Tax=Ilumatobacter fluminis TaxID=467091 RepID=A0A4R7I6A7_9ACTN|nr:acyl-CoA thioesterase domain-containing protein [Ilumatobacter fluminis]TDT18569.1 acyl-CoA thioesterase-2 [Ilumatobacter fluminis]
MFELVNHGPDTFVGTGPRYPWGGLYGGQIVAQALRAAALTVDEGFRAHSIRAYFIRRGDHQEPVRYEVDRIRNGRSFVTRRVVARQAIGAILNAECSFQKPESSLDVQTIQAPSVTPPDDVENTAFSGDFDRRFTEPTADNIVERDGEGRVMAWMRVPHELPESGAPDADIIQQCWLAFLSDDLATDTVRSAHSQYRTDDGEPRYSGVSLDHTIWFHRPFRTDVWQLHDFSCHHFTGSRGLAVGHVFQPDGTHIATVSQEVLLREPKD